MDASARNRPMAIERELVEAYFGAPLSNTFHGPLCSMMVLILPASIVPGLVFSALGQCPAARLHAYVASGIPLPAMTPRCHEGLPSGWLRVTAALPTSIC